MKKEYATLIEVEHEDGSKEKGTAYPIAPDLFLTARHVLQQGDGGPSAKNVKLRLAWHPSTKKMRMKDVHLARGREVDVALIRTKEKLPPDATIHPRGLLAQHPIGTGLLWETRGYPELKRTRKKKKEVDLIGRTHSHASGESRMQLDVDVADEYWSGLSGAPVFVAGRIVGVIHYDPDEMNGNRIHAIPIGCAVADPVLAPLLEEAGHKVDPHQKKLWDAIEAEFEKRSTLCKCLKTYLGLSSNHPTELRAHIWTMSLSELLKGLQFASEGNEKAHQEAQEMAAWLSIASSDLENLKEALRHADGGVARVNVEYARTVELAVGSFHCVPIGFRRLGKAGQTLAGRGLIPTGLEGGADDDSRQLIQDVFTELAPEMGMSAETWDAALRGILKGAGAGHASLNFRERKAVTQFKQWLADNVNHPDPSKGRYPRYAVLACTGEEDELSKQLDKQARKLHGAFPDLQVVRATLKEDGHGIEKEAAVFFRLGKLF